MRRTISTSPYSSGPRILAPPPENHKTTAFQNGSCLSINGKLVPIPISTPTLTPTLTPKLTPTLIPHHTEPVQTVNDTHTQTQPLYVLAVKKRNLYMENKVFIDIEKYDVYQVICFYNNERGATLAYTYYEPCNCKEWRVLSKVLKKVSYNSNVDIDKCETVQEAFF
jgi:hypothetical protein